MPQRFQWNKIANLVSDVAIGADGTVWAVFHHKDVPPAEAGKLYRWDWTHRRWTQPEYASVTFAQRVAVDPEGLPVIINRKGELWRYRSDGSWHVADRETKFRSVAVSPEGVVVGVQDSGDGSDDGHILRWHPENTDDPFERLGPTYATALEVAVGPDLAVWVTNSKGEIFEWIPADSSWKGRPGGGGALAHGGGTPWICHGPPKGPGQLEAYSDGAWHDAEIKDFLTARIAAGPDGMPWVVDSIGRLWRAFTDDAEEFLSLVSEEPQSSPKRPWDMLFVLRTSEINRVLSGPDADAVFDVEHTSEVTDTVSRAKGRIAGWQIVDSAPDFDRRGSKVGTLIFRLDLRDVEVTGGLALADGETVAFDTVPVFIELSLRYVSKEEDSDTHQLVLNPPPFGSDDALDWDIDPDAFTSDAQSSVGPTLLALLGTWVEENWESFDHVFAEIDLFEEIEPHEVNWLRPTAIDYTYYAAEDPAESVLCVLAMTHHRTPDHRLDFVLPNMLGEGTHALVHIGPEMFMRNLIMSSLPGIVSGATAENFSFNEELGSVELTGSVKMHDQNVGMNKPTGKRNYPCPTHMTRFNVELFGDTLFIDSEVKVLAKSYNREIWPPYRPKGVYIKPTWRDVIKELAYVVSDEKRYLTAGHDKDGGIKLVPDEDRTISTSHQEELPKSEGDIAMDWFKMIVPMLLGLIPGAGPFLMALQITWQAVLEELWDAEKRGDMPDPVGLNPDCLAERLSMRWGGFGEFEVQTGEIDHGLTVTGTLKPHGGNT